MWPPEALEFLRELEANNDRDWFKANRARYDAHLIEPAREMAQGLSHLGEAHMFRPYHDTRFHMRPPIKEQVGVAIGYGGAGGYYFELSLDGLLVAAGMHHPASDQLERFRRTIDDGRRAAGFERAVKPAVAAGLELAPPALKRAPRGFPHRPPADRAAASEGAGRVPPPPAGALAALAGVRRAGAFGARVRSPTGGVAWQTRRPAVTVAG